MTTFYSSEIPGEEKIKDKTKNEIEKGPIRNFSVKEESEYDYKRREISHRRVID